MGVNVQTTSSESGCSHPRSARVRIASASLTSAKGPSCTRNSLSVVACDATNAGYSFFLSASTSASASSCLLTAATCTKYPGGRQRVAESLGFAAGVEAGSGRVRIGCSRPTCRSSYQRAASVPGSHLSARPPCRRSSAGQVGCRCAARFARVRGSLRSSARSRP